LDAQLVSALYRTHKYLPASNKISSLYVFDALARAAKHQAVKHGMSGNVDKGNPATFMLKLEGILEDLFVDLSNATAEVPELKARKLCLWLIHAPTYRCVIFHLVPMNVLYFICVLYTTACT
jgi:protein NRD1